MKRIIELLPILPIMVLHYQNFTIFAVNLTKERTRESCNWKFFRKFRTTIHRKKGRFLPRSGLPVNIDTVTCLPRGSPQWP